MEKARLAEILELHKKHIEGKDGGVKADLRGADLQYAELQYADLQYADLCGAAMQAADLKFADLLCAQMQNADLQDSDLRGVKLHNTNLREADLRNANLRAAELQGADLRGADLRGATIDIASWPLWCGSLNVKVDKTIFAQLLYHALAIKPKDETFDTQSALNEFADRVGQPRLQIKEILP